MPRKVPFSMETGKLHTVWLPENRQAHNSQPQLLSGLQPLRGAQGPRNQNWPN
jgi:hypothetical protein